MPAKMGHEPFNKNGEGGRPRIYDDSFVEGEIIELENWMGERQENIFIEDFCLKRGYSPQRLSEFVKQNERFSEAYELFKTRQKVALFKGGLTKKFSYPMCALILSHSHGVVAKTETKVSGDTINPLSFILNTIDGSSKELVNETES